MVNTTRRNTRSSKDSKKTKSVGRKKSKKVVSDHEESQTSQIGSETEDDVNKDNLSDSGAAANDRPTKSKRVAKKGGHKKPGNTITSQLDVDSNTNDQDKSNANNKNKASTVFRSRFPGLELDTFEESLGDWTLVGLRQEIAKQASTANRASQEIDALVKTIRIQYEKRMLMAALMAGVPEVVIWKIVGEGGKKGNVNSWIRFLGFCKRALEEQLPANADRTDWGNRNKKLAKIWKELTDDDRTVFKDPYFFALANLPDFSYVENENVEDDEENLDMEHVEASTSPSRVQQLSEADRLKYQPIFDRLVDVTKLHLCHGQPDPTSSVATLQKKSLAELKKAHHDFSVVCQRYQVTYYLTAVSCGSYEGWAKTFSNNVAFAEWARKIARVPSKFSTYIHGRTVGKEIEGAKGQQPSDERKTRLGHQLNALVDAVYKGNIFPKKEDPEGEIKDKGWPIRIVQKEGSLLSKEALMEGHRSAKDATRRLWLQDIESKRFVIELIPEAERVAASKKNKPKKKKKSQQSAPESHSSNDEQDQPQQSQPQRHSQEPDEQPRLGSPHHHGDEQQPRSSHGRSKKRIHIDSSDSDNPEDEPSKQKHNPPKQRPRLQVSEGQADKTCDPDDVDGSPIENDD